MQLYALKKDFLMRFFSLVSLSRGLKYMAAALSGKNASVSIWVSGVLCSCYIFLSGQQNRGLFCTC